MATRRSPRFKESRRLGVNVCGHPKALKRLKNDRPKKQSDYKLQLLEKQKLKAYYGILERQLRRYYALALKSKEKPGTALVLSLESRLDAFVYHAGYANSIRMARQMVTHGHFIVNGRKQTIPSFGLKPGDVVELKEKSRSIEPFKVSFQELGGFNVPYIEADKEHFKATYVRLPQREEVPIEVDDQLIVEFYSR